MSIDKLKQIAEVATIILGSISSIILIGVMIYYVAYILSKMNLFQEFIK